MTSFISNAQVFDEDGFSTDKAEPYQTPETELVDGELYYAIANVGQLYWFAQFVNKGGDNVKAKARLKKDLVINKDILNSKGELVADPSSLRQWVPIGIGESYSNSVMFNGVFDGCGHTISGVYCVSSSKRVAGVGFFGMTQRTSRIQNLAIVNSYVSCSCTAGLLCGRNDSEIFNCYVSGYVSGQGYVGGVVGANTGIIEDCFALASVHGYTTVGGLCGYNDIGIMSNSFCVATAEDKQHLVGGVCAFSISSISNCYFNSSIAPELPALSLSFDEEETENVEGVTTEKLASSDFSALGDSIWGVGSTVYNSNGTISYKMPYLKIFGEKLQCVINVVPEGYRLAKVYNGTGEPDEVYYQNTADIKLKDNAVALVDSVMDKAPANVICLDKNGNYVADSIVLKDYCPIFFPVSFKAKNILYIRKPSLYASRQKGWETIVLPFDATEYSANDVSVRPFYSTGEGDSYQSSKDGDFWMKQYVSSIGDSLIYKNIEDGVMKAGVSYLVAIPGVTYGSHSLEDATMTYSARNIMVEATDDDYYEIGDGKYAFRGIFKKCMMNSDSVGVYILDSQKNKFILSQEESYVNPFCFYVKRVSTKSGLRSIEAAPRSLTILDYGSYLRRQAQETTELESEISSSEALFTSHKGEIEVYSFESGSAKVYDFNGKLLKSVKFEAGYSSLGYFDDGIYFVNGKKIVVK